MRAVLVAAVLVLGMAGHSGAAGDRCAAARGRGRAARRRLQRARLPGGAR